jgi:heptosyltransferase-2
MNVGVVMPTWLGDVCMATPALTMLRAQRPDAHITAFVSPNTAPLLASHPSIDTLEVLESKGVFATARVLRSVTLDELWLFPGSFRSAAASWLARIKHRIGYARDGRGILLTHAVKQLDRRTCVSTVQWYAHLVQTGTQCQDGPVPPMSLATTDNDRAAASDVLAQVGERFVVLVPGANRLDKRWPSERFGLLATQLYELHGLTSVIIGSPSEADVAEAVVHRAGQTPVVNAVAMGTTVSALKAIIDNACLVVTNDTGPRHIALCVQTPIVALFGPTDHRWTAMHTSNERRLLAEPFLPETHVADRCKDTCRIDRIALSDVVYAAGRAIADNQ